jgi:AsmA-like protein
MTAVYKKPTRRRPIWLGVAILAVVVALTSTWWIRHVISTSGLKERIENYLSEELQGAVTIAEIDGRLFPRVALSGSGVVVRHHGRDDVPPLLTIPQFEISGSYWDLMFATPRHVAEVRLRGLLVQIPPDKDDKDESDKDAKPEKSEAEQIAAARKYEQIIIDRFEAPDTVLKLYSSKPHKPPKEFLIHDLAMNSVGSNQTIPYNATLTNPIPKGEIHAQGTFGPWDVAHPARTPVTGKYEFNDANLDTIDGLAGVLSSVGDFKGPLNRIQVQGTTETPKFQIDVGGKAVPLSTKFSAVVDGSDGDTYLTRVDGKFLNTQLVAKGKVIGLEGVKGRQVEIDFTIDRGRIEDVLQLAMNSAKPLLVGPVQMRANILVPAEKGKKVIDKMKLRGEFGLTDAKFTDASVQQKLIGLSRHGQGKDTAEPVGEVVSDLKGRFVVDHATVQFSELTFGVPGAVVNLAGAYGMRTEQLDFQGELRLEAKLSEAVGGGVKGFFLKAVDPFFKKDGAGTVLPIKITGSRKDPKFGLNLFSKDK